MGLILIAAVSENNVIGKDGKIPWKIPEDMKHFKDLTMWHPVIMGRKTYESIPDKFRPLRNRKNIVLSRNFESDEKIYIARSLEEALSSTEIGENYVIGGKKTYELFLPYADRIELTRVHNFYEGDASFPNINWAKWSLIDEENGKTKDGLEYSFLSYVRKLEEILSPQIL